MKSRRANAVLFGFDFQRNAAIVLMLENIKDLHTLRLEGNHEDIELTLDNGVFFVLSAVFCRQTILMSGLSSPGRNTPVFPAPESQVCSKPYICWERRCQPAR